MGELAGKRIIITGAADGIGWGIAEVCHREGAQLVLFDLDPALIAEKRPLIPEAVWVQGSVASDADLERLVATATAAGRVDGLVNNAGVGSYAGTAENLASDDWDRVINVNLRGAWMLSRLLIPHLRVHGGGCLIFVSSVHATATYPAHFPYNVTKGGIRSMVQAFALDYGAVGIRAVGLAPGWTRTRNNERYLSTVPDPAGEWARVLAAHPLGRVGEPREMGEVASFLLSDRCPFITGTTLNVDGGLLAKMPG